MTFSRTEVVAAMPSDSHEVQVLKLVIRAADLWPKIDNEILSMRWQEGRQLTFAEIRELESVRKLYGLCEQILALLGKAQP